MMKYMILLLLFASCGNVLLAQKEKSIALGPVLSLPLQKFGYPSRFSTGVGGELMGQYKFSKRWSLLVQGGLIYYTVDAYCDYSPCDPTFPDRIISIRAGTRYDFRKSGFYLHLLPGLDKRKYSRFFSALTAGSGKRFYLNTKLYIDTGIDYATEGDYHMLKLKVYFGFYSRN